MASFVSAIVSAVYLCVKADRQRAKWEQAKVRDKVYFKQERQRGRIKTAHNPYQVVLTKPPDCRMHARLPHSRIIKIGESPPPCTHHAQQACAARHHAFSKERKERSHRSGAKGDARRAGHLIAGVKSSGSKRPTSIGQKYISERARWRARKALHEQDRRVHAKRSASLGVGVVSISGAQIACLQARMPIDLGESAVGSVGAFK